MTRTRISLITTVALLSALCASLPAFAQAPAPTPETTTEPPPVNAPPLTPPPPKATPAEPTKADKHENDMTGATGFGVGVLPGSSFIKPDTSLLTVKLWRSDTMAIVPRLKLSLHKETDQNTAWTIEPSAIVAYTLFKGASTRLHAGAGVGMALAKNQDPATAVNSNAHVGLFVPAEIGVEHFFTRWLSIGIAARFDFLNLWKQGDHFSLDLEASDTEYQGSIFIYTD
jgi:hypothetical protein